MKKYTLFIAIGAILAIVGCFVLISEWGKETIALSESKQLDDAESSGRAQRAQRVQRKQRAERAERYRRPQRGR